MSENRRRTMSDRKFYALLIWSLLVIVILVEAFR